MELDGGANKAEAPRDLTAALKRVKGATTAFAKLAPSHQKRYFEWIESAKKPETRSPRVGKAIEMIMQGVRSRG